MISHRGVRTTDIAVSLQNHSRGDSLGGAWVQVHVLVCHLESDSKSRVGKCTSAMYLRVDFRLLEQVGYVVPHGPMFSLIIGC